MEQVFGFIERITFQSDETGFTVAQLQEPKRKDLTCIVGFMPSIRPGETVRCYGHFKMHLIHGKQFEVEKHQVEAPADLIGIKKYLGSGLIKGIGPIYAARIVEKFGIDTLNVIDQEPEKLLTIPRLGKKLIEKIKKHWSEQKSIREVMIFLQQYGVSPAYAQKIFRTYGSSSIEKVKENPFRLASDIHGIGFKTADQIAQKMGIEKNSSKRIAAGIAYVLSELSNEGHVCYPVKEFIPVAEKLLEVSPDCIEQEIRTLNERVEIFEITHQGLFLPFIWLKTLFLAEVGIAKELKRLSSSDCILRSVNVEKALEWVQEKLQIQLATHQKEAVANALQDKVQIITGGPGTGKSTITKAILKVTEQLSSKIILAAPTGRAAKRMSEITGKKASTIHSLLELDFKTFKFKRNRENPLDCDLIILDEASMIDTVLMYSLLKAVPSHARAIFVGDVNQLPSVGPGNVLKDMIDTNTIHVCSLKEIFRQAAGSRIITNAHLINQGSFPDLRSNPDGDFFFIETLNPEHILQEIVALVTHRLPKKYGFQPIPDIQVLSPMKRGVIGTENLNLVLQKALLQQAHEGLLRGGKTYLVGDKVMQIRNNYQKEVFNGDIGKIAAINPDEQEVVVTIDEREVVYDFSEIDELVHAYAVSIHKYQGSESPCIVVPVDTTHFKLLKKNLLYTAVTRGKKMVVLLGTKKAIAICIHNDEVSERFTGLKQAILGVS